MFVDYLQQQPIASWNNARGVWEQPTENILCGHWELFLEAFPTWGSMHNGLLFRLQPLAHHTEGKGSLLLRTPIAGEVEGGAVSPEVAKAKNQTLRLSGQMIDLVAPDQLPKLLPTPNTMDHLPPRTPEALAEAKKRSPAGFSNLRESVVNNLLPTPRAGDRAPGQNEIDNNDPKKRLEVAVQLLPTATARDHKDGQTKHYRDGKLQTDTVSRAVNELAGTWGKFAPAIQRWEQTIGRPAPAPTLPDGKDGKHRLNSAFTEWMMGLPEGWITNAGLTRAEELKACGNGVVPQQAKLALAILLEGVKW